MAELIEKRTIRKIIEKYFESLAPSHYYKMDLEKASVYLDAEIAELPTTTEAEIRAKIITAMSKAMKEYYPSCKGAYRDFDVFFHAVMAKVAEQLKEE